MLCRNLYAPKRVGTKFAKAAPNYHLGSAYQKDECFFPGFAIAGCSSNRRATEE